MATGERLPTAGEDVGRAGSRRPSSSTPCSSGSCRGSSTSSAASAASKAAALEQYLATEQARLATHISLVAAVASTWLALAADAESLRPGPVDPRGLPGLGRADPRRAGTPGVASDLDLARRRARSRRRGRRWPRSPAASPTGRNALDLLVGAPVPAELLPDGLSAVTELARGSSPAFPPKCSCAVPTSSLPSTGSRPPTPTSAPRARRSSPASR